MGRYTGPACRLCRQVGEKLFLKGERCYTPKCAIEKRRRPPGAKAVSRRRPSDFAVRMREKQKARYVYGVMERQFRRTMETAQKKPGVTGQYLLQLLERRLDSVVFRLNFAKSRRQARQLVLHGHITVNGRRMDIPSFIVKPGDVIGWGSTVQSKDFVKEVLVGAPQRPMPSWLSLDQATMTGKVVSVPEPADLDMKLDTRLIVEFYSR
ncbi:MAG: 30S ribosomal protein S4 [Chloroflexi bacterium]|nr:30S ribosomal protein S4 [Chloroflexota bacterium]